MKSILTNLILKKTWMSFKNQLKEEIASLQNLSHFSYLLLKNLLQDQLTQI